MKENEENNDFDTEHEIIFLDTPFGEENGEINQTSYNEPVHIPYQYSSVWMPIVIENPEQYIIPECLKACKCFWRKHIPTFMVSNYNDPDYLYVLIQDLSETNEAIFKKLMQEHPEHYYYDNFRKTYGIYMSGVSEESSENLASLTAPFKIQDTKEFFSEEEFLERYKTTGGEYEMDMETLCMIQLPNPALKNATLEEALENMDSNQVYEQSEHRIYKHQLYLDWHKRYLELSKSAPDLVDCVPNNKKTKSKNNTSIGE